MLNKGLGKGLGALISQTEPDDNAEQIHSIPLEQISANPFQPRKDFHAAKMEDLASSISEHGVLQPVILKKIGFDQYSLVAGERRYRACKMLGLQEIPAIIKDYASTQMLEVALIENVQREDINPVEAAMAYQQLMSEFGLTHEDIAKRVGKARTTIVNTLRLLQLEPEVLDFIKERQLSEGHARALLQVPKHRQAEALMKLHRGHYTVRQAEQLARDMKDEEYVRSGLGDPKSPKNATLGDPHIMALEQALREVLKTKVAIRNNNGVGQITIDFYSENELENLATRLLGPDGTAS